MIRPLSVCSDSQLTQWAAWSACEPLCANKQTDGSASEVRRTRTTSFNCAALLVELKSATCGQRSCQSEVEGKMGLEGVSKSQMNKVDSNGQQPLLDALRASLGVVAGVTEQSVSLGEITAARRMGISVSFTISISTAALGNSAVSSLSSAVSSGGLAAQFSSEAAQRGESVTVIASGLSLIQEVTIIVPTVSDFEYGSWAVLLLCIGVCFVTLWCFILCDIIRVRRALARKKSQKKKVVEDVVEVDLIQSESVDIMCSDEFDCKKDHDPSLQYINPLSVGAELPAMPAMECGADSGAQLQQIFMRCG